jgi:glycosyltransferase involved in cell wall biosynthesis
MATRFAIARRIDAFAADAIHISTEGPIGLATRKHCVERGLAFTSAYHTQFPDYLAHRTHMPADWFWAYIRWFHRPSAAVLAATASVEAILIRHRVGPVRPWGRGVDLDLFRADRPAPADFAVMQRPIQLYVGRVAVEKNIGAFLSSKVPGTKVVVGDGPARGALERAWPDVRFLGALAGDALASAYAGADVLVFPSRTDTFGLVMIEALACGTPVAAYPVTGPIDVLDPGCSALHVDLDTAIALALTRDRDAAAAHGRGFGWRRSAEQFLRALAPLGQAAETRAA